MYVKSLEMDNFRNIESAKLNPANGVNVIFGNNAQGKTNLIEGLYFCSGMGSFRGAKESELRQFEKEYFSICCGFHSFGRDRKIVIRSSEQKRKISLSDVEMKSYSALCEHFKCVVFFPDDLSLIKRSPDNRRRFLDNALCTLKPGYKKLISNYKRAVLQKNSLLKEIFKFDKQTADDMLDGFDRFLAHYGAAIANQRSIYTKKLCGFADEFFSGLTLGKERLTLNYTGEKLFEGNAEHLLFDSLREKRNEDIKNFSTSVGPHRHDLEVLINGISAREFGSQGQQRSAAIALKLSEAEVLKEYTGEKPVVILDDVMSELDSERQEYILNKISGGQVFITCCDPKQIAGLKGGKAFFAENGRFFEREI